MKKISWYLQESNQGHKDFQSFALPTELRHPVKWVIHLFRVQRYDFFWNLQAFSVIFFIFFLFFVYIAVFQLLFIPAFYYKQKFNIFTKVFTCITYKNVGYLQIFFYL